MNFQYWLEIAKKYFITSKTPHLDGEILLSYVTGKVRTFILAFSDTLLTKTQEIKLLTLFNRRKYGEPIAYIIGKKEFWSLPLLVSPASIIPRPDTECLVEQALAHLPSYSCIILDLGTGTGAITLAMASERPDCKFIAVDIMQDAVALAIKNVKLLKLTNVEILQSNWFKFIKNKKFDMIVSNPPYIDKKDHHLKEGDVSFEPRTALVSAKKGLADIKYIINTASQYLYSGGWLLLEHGYKQSKIVRYFFLKRGYKLIKTYLDYSGKERITLGKWE